MKKHCSFNLMLVAAIATVTASLFQPLQLATAFVFSRPVSKRVGILLNQPAQQQQRTALLASKNVGEFSVINEGEEEYHEENKEEEEEEEEYHEHEEEEDSEHGVASAEDDDNNIDGARLQYAALPLGSATVQIQVGDLALARKAWKKRRRSGSPLLIPCSILNVDRTSMLRSNLVYILYKFGSDQKDGIVLSVNDLNRRHKSHLKSSLQPHANALGYETVRQLVEALFVPEMVMKDTDGEAYLFLDKDADELYLKAPMSKYLALRKAETMAIIQVTPTDEPDTMRHTGFTRFKREPEEGEQKRKGQVFYSFPFLSAAIRASQEDVESGHIQNGSSHPGMLLDFDQQGDGGNPLITLTLNQPRRRNKAIKKSFSQNGYVHPKYTPIKKPKYVYNNLQIGQGPFDAKVVRLGKDHALVDFGVGRKFQASKERSEANTAVGSPEYVKVYGMLRFKDAIDLKSMAADKSRRNDTRKAKQQKAAEDKIFADMDNLLESVEGNLEDGEEVEDITNLFELNESGELTYKNPETGEVEVVSSNDDDEEDAFDSDYEEESKSVHDEPVTFVNNISPARQRRQAKILRLKVGEKVPVYISSIAKQSSQFMVTTDPSLVEGKTAKDIKKEGDVRKKLDRLSEVLGGLERAEELKGKEYYGTVKATSRAGDWLYVQPTGENEDDMSLPVGVATIGGEASAFSQGDRVRIRMDGIDESRGQLAMHVLEKLSP